MRFAWTGGDGADSFRVVRLIQNARLVVVDDIPGTETGYDLDVFLPRQVGANYEVEACNAAGCVASPAVEIGREALDLAIGYVKASNPGVDSRFGHSVAVSADGQVLAVGAPLEDGGGAGVDPPVNDDLPSSGAVYVFTRTGAGQWSGPVYVKAPVPGASDSFGVAVALSADGSVLAVGATLESGGGTGVNPPHDDDVAAAGAVYVYVRSESGQWGDPTYLKAGQVDGGDRFGEALALSADGDVLVVGAPGEDGSGGGVNPPVDESAAAAGAVWVFERSAAGIWQQTAYIKAPEPSAGDFFGFSVALSADGAVLAVGSTGEDGSGTGVGPPIDEVFSGSGAVWVYSREAGGTWAFEEYLKASNTGPGDLFGSAVSLSADGSLLAVGAYDEDGSGTGVWAVDDDLAEDSGAVYVFARDAEGAWTGPRYVKPGEESPGANFGYRLAWSADGTALVVGAPGEGEGGTGVHPPPTLPRPGSGAVWMYERSSEDEWGDPVRLKASNTGDGDGFGGSLAVSGAADVLAVGASREGGGDDGIGGDQNDNSMPNAGAVYLY